MCESHARRGALPWCLRHALSVFAVCRVRVRVCVRVRVFPCVCDIAEFLGACVETTEF